MRTNRVVLMVVVALALVAAAVTAAAPAATTSPAQTSNVVPLVGATPLAIVARCTNGVSDRINGRVVCIHVGGKCVAAHNAKYRARGYTCVKGRLRRVSKPAISVGDASAAEGNSGTTTLAVPVTLSASSTSTVMVDYATADGTASAGSDYAAVNGKVVFRPGETQKSIPVSIAGDTSIEQDETFSVTLSNPVNATIAEGSATATITNDDTAAAVTPGSYQGLAKNGSYVFFTVTSDRTITALRFNDLTEICNPPATLPGGSDFGTNVFHIDSAGHFHATGSWTGSDKQGDIEYTSWSADVVGAFAGPTSVSGTIVEKYELNYQGTHYSCSSGQITWSAARQS
jgi:Calx-beta domain